jgi:hypothetical protein
MKTKLLGLLAGIGILRIGSSTCCSSVYPFQALVVKSALAESAPSDPVPLPDDARYNHRLTY